MRRLTSPGWLLKHAIVLVLVAGFLILGWWQFGRARQGNALSLGYTFEWPLFAAFVIFMWVREMRIARYGPRPDRRRSIGGRDEVTGPTDTPAASHRTGDGAGADRSGTRTATDDGPAGITAFDLDAELARRAREQRRGPGVDETSDYNQYLAWLAANPEVRPRDYRRSGAATEENAHG